MKKMLLVILTGLVFLWINPAFGESEVIKINGKEMQKQYFLQTIESGDLEWDSFIDAVINQKVTFDELSPSAVANYLEGIANEGMMDLIPADYFYDEDVQVASTVVFEDPLNICNNSSVYKEQME